MRAVMMIQDAQYQTTTGLNQFTLPVGGIDIFDAVIRRAYSQGAHDAG